MSQAAFLKRLIQIFVQAEIPYMLVGSMASTVHGAPRATQDVDVVIDPTRASLIQLLNGLPLDEYYVDADAAHDALQHRSQFNVIDLATGWKADLVVPQLEEIQPRGADSTGSGPHGRPRSACGEPRGHSHIEARVDRHGGI